MIGHYCERVTPLRAFCEEYELLGSFPVDQESSGFLQNLSKDSEVLWSHVCDSEDPELFLQVAIFITGSQKTHVFRPENLKSLGITEHKRLFSCILTHIYKVRNNREFVFKMFQFLEDKFGYRIPCAEQIRFEKARFLLANEIFDEELVRSLDMPYRKECTVSKTTGEYRNITNEKRFWSTRLNAIKGVVINMFVTSTLQVKSLWELNSETDLSDSNVDIEASSQLLENFFKEAENHPELIFFEDCSKKDNAYEYIAGLLSVYSDLKRFQYETFDALQLVRRFSEESLGKIGKIEQLVYDLENDRPIDICNGEHLPR